MYEDILRMLRGVISNFGRPKFDLGDDTKIQEADKTTEELQKRRKELERRLELLRIQSTPRGPFNG